MTAKRKRRRVTLGQFESLEWELERTQKKLELAQDVCDAITVLKEAVAAWELRHDD